MNPFRNRVRHRGDVLFTVAGVLVTVSSLVNPTRRLLSWLTEGILQLGCIRHRTTRAIDQPQTVATPERRSGKRILQPASHFAEQSLKQFQGQSRASLAKLAAGGTGAADATWNPNPTVGFIVNPISALLPDGSGKLYATDDGGASWALLWEKHYTAAVGGNAALLSQG